MVVLAATNRLDRLDPALLRPGPAGVPCRAADARRGGAARDPGGPDEAHAARQGREYRDAGARTPRASSAPISKVCAGRRRCSRSARSSSRPRTRRRRARKARRPSEPTHIAAQADGHQAALRDGACRARGEREPVMSGIYVYAIIPAVERAAVRRRRRVAGRSAGAHDPRRRACRRRRRGASGRFPCLVARRRGSLPARASARGGGRHAQLGRRCRSSSARSCRTRPPWSAC